GLLFIGWLLPFAGQVEAMYGLGGWFDEEAYLLASRLPEGPPAPLGWSVLYAAGSNGTLLQLFYWGALVVFVLFPLGVATRITRVLTWVMVVSFLASPATRFEAEYLLGVLAFYLMVGYVLLGQWSGNLTPLGRFVGTRDTLLFGSGVAPGKEFPSYAANLALR